MKFTINVWNVVMIGAILFLGWYSFIRKHDNAEFDLYKSEHEKVVSERNAKFTADSLNLIIQFNYILHKKDSTIDFTKNESYKRQQTINSYAKKIKNLQVVPISVIDAGLDSLFRTR